MEITPDKQTDSRPGRGRVKTSWKPGQSGNPKGRTPKKLCLTSLLKEALEQIEEGDTKTNAEKVVEALVSVAKDKKARAFAPLNKEVFDRVDGSVPTKVQGDIKGTLELEVTYVNRKKGE